MPRREGRGGGLGPGRNACSDPFDDRTGRVPECDRAAVRVHFGRIRARPEKRVVKAEQLKDLLGKGGLTLTGQLGDVMKAHEAC